MTSNDKIGSVVVVGGGIAGMQSAIDLAESGFKVYLVENSPAIGGHMAQLDKTFPTNDCAMCTLAPRMVDAGRHANIEKLTYSEITGIRGEPGHFQVVVRRKPRSVDPDKCTGCGECTLHCPVRYRPYKPTRPPEPILTAEEKETVDDLIDRYAYKRAPLLSVLQGINAKSNYLPRGSLEYLSQRLNMPLAHILAVATFYALFSLKPRGRHIISMCQGTACYARGAERLMERLQEMLEIGVGEVTKDRKFSLELVRCLGCCALAPVLKVGEQIHGKLRPANVEGILKGY